MVMQLYGQKSLKASHHLTKFFSHKHCGSGDSWSGDLAKPHGQRVMRLYWQEPINVSYHSKLYSAFSLSPGLSRPCDQRVM